MPDLKARDNPFDPHGEEARAPEQAEPSEAVANGAKYGAPSPDDATHRRENHEASSFETQLTLLLRMRGNNRREEGNNV
jgi:hypothetical protein